MINVDAQEIAKFEALAHRWWDADGEFKPLHDINGPRVEYIGERCTVAGSSVLDAGCGGGLLTEALHGLGANVMGIDAGEAPLAVARLHAIEAGIGDGIRYVAATPESYLANADREPAQFSIVTCLETLEHVPDVGSTVQALAALTEPGGDLFLSTINRTPKAFALAIVGAEYVLNILPKGTHRYEKLIRPLGVGPRLSGRRVGCGRHPGHDLQPVHQTLPPRQRRECQLHPACAPGAD